MPSILLLLCVGVGLAVAWSAKPYALEDAEQHFEHFIQKYGRNYASEYEKQVRFNIFKVNLEKINQLNQNSHGTVFGITQFSDLSPEEFNKYKGFNRASVSPSHDNVCTYITDADIHDNDAPESYDWRDQNGVTPVKDQGNCGSCYAFSTTGNIESQYAIKHKQQIDISEQQILDCDKRNEGCGGGLMDYAFRGLIEKGGIEAEADYPYKSHKSDECQFDAKKVEVKLTDCRSYNLTSQEKLKQLLYHYGPISIGVQADALHFYKKGIISDKQCDSGYVDHAVLLVGYGSENGTQFWSVKNSWAESFGEKGYFRMHRGENALSCGMMNIFMASSIIA